MSYCIYCYLNKTIGRVLFCMALALSSIPAYSQLSFRMDSLNVKTISDYKIDSTQRLIWNEYEEMIMYGPCAEVWGMLKNEYDHPIIVQSSWFSHLSNCEDHGIISRIMLFSSFIYNLRWYYSKNLAIMGDDTIHFIDRNKIHIKDSEKGEWFLGVRIERGESVPIHFITHYFVGTSLSNLKVYDKKGRYGYHKFYWYNIKEGFRLEEISKEVVNTLQFTPVLLVFDKERFEHYILLQNSAIEWCKQ